MNMKKYYQTLNKEQKQEIKKLYNKKYTKSDLEARLNRLIIYSGAGYFFGAIILIYALKFEQKPLGSIIIAITLIIIATVYLIGRYIIKQNVLNKIAIKNKK